MSEEIQFKADEQQQGQLFAGHLRGALDPSDPVFFIDDAVEMTCSRNFGPSAV